LIFSQITRGRISHPVVSDGKKMALSNLKSISNYKIFGKFCKLILTLIERGGRGGERERERENE